ncbi:PREDICTED: uncharacterized protein LOC109185026 [Ipomoea nil]|uniref:uncharacterized protein LOC109185026 n=1 Tax=Ipomoea nil TaxID=35883 RepID=UPI00090092A4|nr:PREDICTED: uncharacterized protein LOC109185026 [Ipomoea nil]
METELKIKGKLGSKRSLPMPVCGARCKKRKQVESDSKGPKDINTSQQGVPEIIELQFVDDICGCRENFPDYCVQEEENGWSVIPDDDDDPQYKIFLASTVQRGTSYTTTLEENGSPVFLHYETENVCGDESDYVCRSSVKNIKKGHDDGRGEGDDDDPQYLIFLANTVQKGTSYETKLEENGLPLFIHYEKEDVSGEERGDVSRRRAKNIKKVYNDNGGGNVVDPQYMTFLANTVQKGTSYVTKLEENGLPLFIHYEKEDGSSEERGDVGRRRAKNIKKGYNDNGGGNDVDPKYMTFLANTVKRGTSHTTTLEENGLPLFIHYEKEDGSGVESGDVSRRRVKNIKKGYNDNGWGNDVDPKYMTFLANTAQRSTSYTTTLEENGSPLFLHHEKEDGCDDDPVDVCRRRVKNIEKGHNAREKAFGTVSGKYKVERANGFKMVLEKNKDVSVVVDNDVDPKYMTFLDNIVQRDTSYTVSAVHRLVPKSHYEYNIDSGSHKERSTQNWRISEKDREEENIEEDCLVLNQNITCENYAVKTSSSGNWHMERGCNHSEGVEAIPNNYAVVCKERSPELSPGNQHVEYDLKDWEEEDIDYAYRALLQNMTCQNYAIKAWQSNQLVEYGCNHSEDVEVIQNDDAMVCKERSPGHFISSTEYLSLDATSELLGETMQSPFRKKIIDILKKPYNQSEYEELSKDVKVRKPILKHLELRNGRDTLYPTSRKGKSYLDHHKDLKKILEKVRTDKHKRLNILRGFFFWLQNVTLVGVFKPWNDPTCLDIVPGSC